MQTNFQSESKKVGMQFEKLVEEHLKDCKKVILHKNYKFNSIGIDVDFVATDGLITEYIEVKGGAPGHKKRPGAQRTDSVKKAIANGALLKSFHPDLRFVIYFSAKPTPGSSSDLMLQNALNAGYVDDVRYIAWHSEQHMLLYNCIIA